MLKYKPPPMRLPLEYAEALGCDSTHLIHVNAGRKRLNMEMACQLLEVGADDPRLAGLTIFHLRPEVEIALPHICKLCPRAQKKLAKKVKARNRR